MNLSDVFTARSVAYRYTKDPSRKRNFIGEAFFPKAKKAGIDLQWIKAGKGKGVMLDPSSFDTLATLRNREIFNVTKTQMPLFRESMIVSEKDMIEIQRATEANDPYLSPVIEEIYNDVDELLIGAEVAAEAMRMQLLAPKDGNLAINLATKANTASYSYKYDADGEWKRTNYLAIESGSTWEKVDAAAPLSDIDEAIRVLKRKSHTPTYIMMNSSTLRLLTTSKQVKDSMVLATGYAINYLDSRTAKEVVERMTGLKIIINDDAYVASSEQQFYPDGYVTIIGAEDLGKTWYGVTPEERTLMGDSKVDVSVIGNGPTVSIQNLYGPPVTHTTTVSQIVLPSFEGMDGEFVIKVK